MAIKAFDSGSNLEFARRDKLSGSVSLIFLARKSLSALVVPNVVVFGK